jgi:periplasmic protein CpxP/Spy
MNLACFAGICHQSFPATILNQTPTMNLKLLAVGCLFATLLTSCADKPRRGSGPPDGGGISMGNQPPEDPQQMADELALSGDQRNKFVSIMQAHGEKVRAIRADSSMSQKDRRKKMKSLREKLEKQVKGVLTPDQFSQWQAKREAMRSSMQGQGAGGPQGPGGPGAPQGYGLPPGQGYGAPQQPSPLGNEPPPPLPGNQ